MRETTATFLNYILSILVNNMAEDISTSMKRPLVEELELQGFLPLKESFQLVDFQSSLIHDNNPMNIDDRVLGILKRMTKIKAFGLILANYQVPDSVGHIYLLFSKMSFLRYPLINSSGSESKSLILKNRVDLSFNRTRRLSTTALLSASSH